MNTSEHLGIHLLKKGQKGIVSVVFSRLGIFVVMILLQLLCFVAVIKEFGDFLPHIYGLTIGFTVLVAIYLLSTEIDPTAKITWLIAIMALPVFSAILFIYTQTNVGNRRLTNRIHHIIVSTRDQLLQNPDTYEELKEHNAHISALSTYVNRSDSFPIHKNSSVKYFPLGEDKFKEMLIQLEQAKKFIFLEYFIISEGKMWGQILEILAKKAKEGVDVRVMYDGTCEFSVLPHSYPKKLEAIGIKCKAFAPLTPFVSTHYNYRDHRKILVIDGHTAFTGGVNLADEYINEVERFGHWKDTAVMVKGPAVRNFTLMFLQLWSITETNTNYEEFLSMPCNAVDTKGYVMPYADCPLDDDKVGEQVYMDILNRAHSYVHIMTPYLILDGELENALKFAAERGVDVKIILPGIPDKKIPYALAYTHYKPLLRKGIEIYQYTPGFVHAKSFVCDNIEAVVGTINLDYRSLYHHFECATYMYDVDCIPEIEKDFMETLKKCEQITLANLKSQPLSRKIRGFLLKGIAPMI